MGVAQIDLGQNYLSVFILEFHSSRKKPSLPKPSNHLASLTFSQALGADETKTMGLGKLETGSNPSG
jgi:hypothetical protein